MSGYCQTAKRADWETPPELFARVQKSHQLTLDVCACDYNAKLPRFFSPEQNGLKQNWNGERCWMNPPYGREIVPWVKKAAHSEYVVALLPARTDTAWWHDYVNTRASHIEFLRGRLRFVGATASAPFASVIVIWRNK